MQGNPKVIESLNAGLTIELTAINQYFVQAQMCRNWGLGRLATKLRDEAIDEMKHAEMLIDRILFLEGVPEMARYNEIHVGTDVKQQIENDLALERQGVTTYNEAIKLCIDEKDTGSRELMEKILVQSEETIDWLEAQLDLIGKVGIENYLAEQMGEKEN